MGDRDPFVPVDQAWRLKRQLPDARLLVAPDCGHEVIRQAPTVLREALTAFYRSTEAVAAARAEGRPAPPRRAAGARPDSPAHATPTEGAS